jgi:DNA polymerase-3 subunit epsilon
MPTGRVFAKLGLCVLSNGIVADTFATLVDPETYFDPWNIQIHRITAAMVRGQPSFPRVAGGLRYFVASAVVASHTAFDRLAVERVHSKYNITSPSWRWLDTARVARRAWKEFAGSGYGLAEVAAYCGIEFRHHDALEDAKAPGLVLVRAMHDTGLDVTAWLQREQHPIDPGSVQVSRDGNQEGALAGEVVVFTSSLVITRGEAATRAAKLGCDVRNTVTSKTTILVVGQQDLARLGGCEKSAKQRKAEELVSDGVAIAILGEDDFMHLGDLRVDKPPYLPYSHARVSETSLWSVGTHASGTSRARAAGQALPLSRRN